MSLPKITKILGSIALTGLIGVAGSAFAAENAAGVKEHFGLTVKTIKEAHDAAKAGNKEGCLASIKQARQHYKEITGDAAGKPMQDAMKLVREAQGNCEGGNLSSAGDILEEVGNTMEKLNAAIK